MPYLQKMTLGSDGSPEIRLVENGSMGDLYVKRDWKLDENGKIHIDGKTNLPILIDTEYKKVGTIFPKAHSGWNNNLTYKGVSINFLITGRFRGSVVSNTQPILDRFGVSEYSYKLRQVSETVAIKDVTIPVRDYLNIIAAGTGQGENYIYNATNVRLSEASINYKIPGQWTKNKLDITIGVYATNLAMLYNKAPFDPELAASSNNIYYSGVDYFMLPSLRSIGFNMSIQL